MRHARPWFRRVAVTGMGCVSALGVGVGAFRDGLRNCRSGIEIITASFPDNAKALTVTYPAARVKDFDCGGMDPFAAFALAASREAVVDSGIDLTAVRARTAVIIGTAVGGDQSRDAASYRAIYKDARPHPLTIVRSMSNGAASAVSMCLKLGGPAFAIASACASGTHALGEAFRMVGCGFAEAAVAGGSEALPAWSLLRSWQQMRVMSPHTCRPFARDRNGMVLGEGAAVLLLEPLEAALERGARIYGEVTGYGLCADAADWVNPDPRGLTRSLAAAAEDAGVEAADLGYVNAHGTGTERGDAAEWEAIRGFLGAATATVPVSSTKPLHGHALGATGAMEAIAALLAVSENWLPPMPAFEQDPACELCLVTNPLPDREVRNALTCSSGFGGLNASLVFRRVET